MTQAPIPAGGAVEAGEAKPLTPTMLAVLQDIAAPHPDGDSFPPVQTCEALLKLGLIRLADARRDVGLFSAVEIALQAFNGPRIEITEAGKAVLAARALPLTSKEDRT